MHSSILLELTYNAALLLSLGVVYEVSYFFPAGWKKLTPVFNGLCIGAIGVLVMMLPFNFIMGINFDTRSILIAVTYEIDNTEHSVYFPL